MGETSYQQAPVDNLIGNFGVKTLPLLMVFGTLRKDNL